MTWFKLEDDFPDHPKVVEVGAEAAWLYVCGLAYCSRLLTDGLIPKAVVARLADLRAFKAAEKVAQRLVAARLWEDQGDTYLVHDYAEYQRTAGQVEDDRTKGRERKRRQRHTDVTPMSRRDIPRSPAVSPADVTLLEVEVEVDTEKDKDGSAGSGQRKPSRRTKLPPDFELTDDLRSWAKVKWNGNCPDLETETEQFKDHHTAKGSVMADWNAAWRTWMTNAVRFAGGRRPGAVVLARPKGFAGIDAAEQLMRERGMM